MKLSEIINTLKQEKITIAAAESCSGGYLAYLLTSLPGSSKIFKGGVVAYSLEAKKKLLGVPYTVTKKTSGVSGETAAAMAKNIRKILSSDIGLSIVGVAGPAGPSGIKVGTVYMAIADTRNIKIYRCSFKGNRDKIRKEAGRYLMKKLYRWVAKRKKY